MPKYTFTCKCGLSKQIYVSSLVKKHDCECGSNMNRELPTLGGIKTTETIDKFTNRKHVTNQKEILYARKQDYYWAVEVPKLVESGVYGLDTMIEKGWVYYDEKHNLVTRTKPPQRS